MANLAAAYDFDNNDFNTGPELEAITIERANPGKFLYQDAQGRWELVPWSLLDFNQRHAVVVNYGMPYFEKGRTGKMRKIPVYNIVVKFTGYLINTPIWKVIYHNAFGLDNMD